MSTSKDNAIFHSQLEIITKDELLEDIIKLGVQRGDLLNVKVSLKSIGYVEGGGNTVIEALLEAVGSTGTIVTDSFVPVYSVPLSKKNARKISNQFTPSYAGALANAMINHSKSYRSLHPIQKFSAIGFRAKELMANHTAKSEPYDVLKIMAESGGLNLKIGTDEKVVGVGTTHVAIGILKIHQNMPRLGLNYLDEFGNLKLFEINWPNGCPNKGFNNFIPLYRSQGAILSEGKIGNASSKITSMKKTLEIELEKLEADPSFFTCDNPACVDCRLSYEFSKGSKLNVYYYKSKEIISKIRELGFQKSFSRFIHRMGQ